jgi:hypothetical protein
MGFLAQRPEKVYSRSAAAMKMCGTNSRNNAQDNGIDGTVIC